MFERQQDAMAYVGKFVRPDLFTTVTTNPMWPEILENLTPGQQPNDRPDLLVRVFLLKIQNLLKNLEGSCFGCLKTPVLCGLPHYGPRYGPDSRLRGKPTKAFGYNHRKE